MTGWSVILVTDCQIVTEMTSTCMGTSGVIPLSVEMLSDSDDEDDRKPQLIMSKRGAAGQPGGGSGGDGQSKLLLLQMASEVVEAAAAAASKHTPAITQIHGMSLFCHVHGGTSSLQI